MMRLFLRLFTSVTWRENQYVLIEQRHQLKGKLDGSTLSGVKRPVNDLQKGLILTMLLLFTLFLFTFLYLVLVLQE